MERRAFLKMLGLSGVAVGLGLKPEMQSIGKEVAFIIDDDADFSNTIPAEKLNPPAADITIQADFSDDFITIDVNDCQGIELIQTQDVDRLTDWGAYSFFIKGSNNIEVSVTGLMNKQTFDAFDVFNSERGPYKFRMSTGYGDIVEFREAYLREFYVYDDNDRFMADLYFVSGLPATLIFGEQEWGI